MSKSKRKFACNARFLFCKDGAICAKNSGPKRTSHGVACAIVKGTSLRSPSPIMSPDVNEYARMIMESLDSIISNIERGNVGTDSYFAVITMSHDFTFLRISPRL